MRRLLPASILLILLLSTPAPASLAQGGSTKFAVLGDYGSGNSNEAAVASLIASWNPAYIVTTGDGYRAEAGGSGTGKYDNSNGRYYCAFLKDITTSGTWCPTGLAPINKFFPALGNHEYSDGGDPTGSPGGISNYLAYFTLPGAGIASPGNSGNERYYDVVQGPVHFYIINSNTQEPAGTSSTSTQAQWLQAQLAASTSPWDIVLLHHPPYSSSTSHGSNPYMQWPFAAWGADVVIGGHDHTYERILRDGIVYFVNGTGGAALYACGTPVTGSQFCYSASFGAQRVVATDTTLDFEFITTDGVVRDTQHLSTTPPTPPSPPTNLVATAVSQSQINLNWIDNASDETGFRIERSPDGATWTQIATVGAGITSYANTGLNANTTYYYQVRAYNSAGDSAYSNVVHATTFASESSHVGDLDGSTTTSKSKWTVTVTITVHDANHQAVSSATVAGTWSAGVRGTSSCTTNSSGVCSVSKANLKTSVPSVTFTVTDVTKSGYVYQSSSNHDVDGGSNGTTITVTQK
jgi:tartrate-resistant acid phosphatase type 5